MPRHHDDLRSEAAAARKVASLLAGDFLLCELTAERELRVLHLPRRLSPPAACAGRASRRAAGGASPAP
jgi:hypothetical protein